MELVMKKTVEIGEHKITITEMTLGDILEILKEFGPELFKKGKEGVEEFIEKWLPRYIDLPEKDLEKFGFSALEFLYKEFEEVNKVFFVLMRRLMASPIGAEIKIQLIANWRKAHLELLKRATSMSSNTDGASS